MEVGGEGQVSFVTLSHLLKIGFITKLGARLTASKPQWVSSVSPSPLCLVSPPHQPPLPSSGVTSYASSNAQLFFFFFIVGSGNLNLGLQAWTASAETPFQPKACHLAEQKDWPPGAMCADSEIERQDDLVPFLNGVGARAFWS